MITGLQESQKIENQTSLGHLVFQNVMRKFDINIIKEQTYWIKYRIKYIVLEKDEKEEEEEISLNTKSSSVMTTRKRTSFASIISIVSNQYTHAQEITDDN
ncbi:hypothetical protein HN011_001391 [Eciton burchellii]|nr:hypothetical protein HN011_001391 [Eciton burchellii]